MFRRQFPLVQLPIRFGKTANFGEPIPLEIFDGAIKYILGSDSSQKFLSSKL